MFDRRFLSKTSWRRTWTVRQERIKKEGSEYFTWQVGVVAATVLSHIEIARQFPRAKKYEPLDWIEVVNNESAINLTLTINGGETFPVPAGTIRTLDNKKLWEISVTNNHAADSTTAGLVVVTLRRQPKTIDDWARRQG